jgi:hypothetical protein
LLEKPDFGWSSRFRYQKPLTAKNAKNIRKDRLENRLVPCCPLPILNAAGKVIYKTPFTGGLHLNGRCRIFLLPDVPAQRERTMVSKCSNSACTTSFRYLHEGKLFRMAVPTDASSLTDPRTKKISSRIEFFWLCAECAPEMTLIFKPGLGVTALPLPQSHAAAAS